MGIFGRFRRKSQESVLPEEVNKYYETKQKERKSTALLVGLATLVFTLIISISLFYGVRYAYRALTGDDHTAEVTNVDEEIDVEEQAQEAIPNDESIAEEQVSPQDSDQSRDSEPSSTESTQPGSPTESLPANGDSLPAAGDPGR